ncbi:PHP domain-containing protein [Candidatus Omnitrophota bacterium]
MKFADLHLHTEYSDSTYTPEELISAAEGAGLSCVAVVDHDNASGITPCLEAAKGKAVEVLSGIELTAAYNGLEIHFLGYLIDHTNHELLKKMEFLKDYRVERIYKITEKLRGLGLEIDAQDVFDIGGLGTVGRLHIARAMVKKGLIPATAVAFKKYIGDKCPAYVCGFRLNPKEAIDLIRGVGGVPVLAHPYTLGNDELITEFVKVGLMGLEVYYPEHSKSMTEKYLKLAKAHDLLVSGGSDCHGKAKPKVKIGSVKIDYSLVEKIKAAKEKACAK